MEKEHEPETCRRNRDEEEGDTQHQEDGIDNHEQRLLAKATSKGNGASHAHHVRDFAYAKEKSCVEEKAYPQPLPKGGEMKPCVKADNVGKVIGDCGSSDGTEEIKTEGRTNE